MITKLATFRGVSTDGEPLVRVFHPGDSIKKVAGVLMPDVQNWLSSYKKQDGKIAVLVNAMGASEYWGQNINGDIFYESSLIHDCRRHSSVAHPIDDFTGKTIPPYGYWTFLNALPYVHHKNKDPSRAFGKVVVACWNPKMRRVEIVVILDRALAMQHGAQGVIDRIDAGEHPDVSMGCLPAGSRILMGDGSISAIECIREGDYVITHRGRPNKVTSVMQRKTSETLYSIKVYGFSRPLELTGEHPLWLVRGDQLECSPSPKKANSGRKQRHCTPFVKESSKGCAGCLTVPSFQFQWTRTDQAEVGDYLAFPIPTQVVDTVSSKEEAEFLGYYLAEGFVKKYNSEKEQIVFCLGLDEVELSLRIESLARQLGSLVVWHNEDPEGGGRYVNVVSKRLADRCIEFCGKGAKYKSLSSDIVYMSPDLQLSFLGAYLDGDGGSYKGSAYFSTASEELANQLFVILSRCGIISSVNRIRHYPSKNSVVQKETVEYQVWVGTDFAHLLAPYTRKPVGKSLKIRGQRFFYEDDSGRYILSPILEIKEDPDYDNYVYNFSVEEDESYVAEGLAVHNCRVPYDRCSLCNKKSKTRNDYCSCLKEVGVNKILDDGRQIGMINDYPRFFDISFVFIGADKTAKMMCKLGSASSNIPQSVLDAEYIYGESDELVKAASSLDKEKDADYDLLKRVFTGAAIGALGGAGYHALKGPVSANIPLVTRSQALDNKGIDPVFEAGKRLTEDSPRQAAVSRSSKAWRRGKNIPISGMDVRVYRGQFVAEVSPDGRVDVAGRKAPVVVEGSLPKGWTPESLKTKIQKHVDEHLFQIGDSGSPVKTSAGSMALVKEAYESQDYSRRGGKIYSDIVTNRPDIAEGWKSRGLNPKWSEEGYWEVSEEVTDPQELQSASKYVSEMERLSKRMFRGYNIAGSTAAGATMGGLLGAAASRKKPIIAAGAALGAVGGGLLGNKLAEANDPDIALRDLVRKGPPIKLYVGKNDTQDTPGRSLVGDGLLRTNAAQDERDTFPQPLTPSKGKTASPYDYVLWMKRKTAADVLAGGKADGKPASDFSQSQLEMGAKVEKEHTHSGELAEEIARDHLEEIPDYYTRLKKMEERAKSEGKLKEASFRFPGPTLSEELFNEAVLKRALIGGALGGAGGAAADSDNRLRGGLIGAGSGATLGVLGGRVARDISKKNILKQFKDQHRKWQEARVSLRDLDNESGRLRLMGKEIKNRPFDAKAYDDLNAAYNRLGEERSARNRAYLASRPDPLLRYNWHQKSHPEWGTLKEDYIGGLAGGVLGAGTAGVVGGVSPSEKTAAVVDKVILTSTPDKVKKLVDVLYRMEGVRPPSLSSRNYTPEKTREIIKSLRSLRNSQAINPVPRGSDLWRRAMRDIKESRFTDLESGISSSQAPSILKYGPSSSIGIPSENMPEIRKAISKSLDSASEGSLRKSTHGIYSARKGTDRTKMDYASRAAEITNSRPEVLSFSLPQSLAIPNSPEEYRVPHSVFRQWARNTKVASEKTASGSLQKVFSDAASIEIGPPPTPNRKEFPFVGTINFNGLTIHIENAPGDVREGTDPRGKKWRTEMKLPYGEINGTLGVDQDKLDAYVGPYEDADNVYIIHQNKVTGEDKGTYDEDKVMLGFKDAEQAKDAYLAHYNRPDYFRSMTVMSLDLFKKALRTKEVHGEKVASAYSHMMEKVALDIRLEDLFVNSGTDSRRVRVWKDKESGKETVKVDSGMGSFDKTKTASAPRKIAAQLKSADIEKEIPPYKAVGRASALSRSEEDLPPDVLDSVASSGVERALATPSLMGMVLKPEEFQRMVLVCNGHKGLADDLDSRGAVFGPTEGEEPLTRTLSDSDFSDEVLRKLLPYLENRSYFGPVVRRRVIRIIVRDPKPVETQRTEETSPLLSKIGAAYNWYRKEQVKLASAADRVIRDKSDLGRAILGVTDVDLFKGASHYVSVDPKLLGVMVGSVPLSLMYSAHLRDAREGGQDLPLWKDLIADHPILSTIGSLAALRKVLQTPQGRQAVEEIFSAGKRIWTGKSSE